MIDVVTWGVAGAAVGAGLPGRAWLGASRGGAVDLDALALANRVVGNPPGAPALETSGGLVVRVASAALVAVTGALVDLSVEGGPPLGWGAATLLPQGAVLRVGRLLDGARAYVAVRGGMDGRVSPLAAPLVHPLPRPARRTTVHVWPGPRLDWFAAGAWEALLAGPLEVTSTSRVGTRCSGPVLHRVRDGELPSEGLVEGAVQVPPDGRPIVMLADHPTTGGYPVIAIVDPADLGVVAQAPAGSHLHLVAAR